MLFVRCLPQQLNKVVIRQCLVVHYVVPQTHFQGHFT